MVYLDHAATTPLRPEALAAMLPFLTEHYGNPSGSHAVARRAKQAIEEARDTVAAVLGCEPGEVVFTGSGTEADNLAVLGRVAARPGTAVCSAVEHHAVLHATHATPGGGTVVPVDAGGIVDLDALAGAIDDGTSVVSVMLANNEVGIVQPIEDVVRVVRQHAPNAAVHTDAVQAFPWLDIAHLTRAVDLIAISAHKFGGPKGTGVLVIRKGTAIAPVVHGGGQEADRRSGTHNVAGIVGLAAAAAVTVRDRAATVTRVARLRDRLLDALHAALPPGTVTETGRREDKVAGSAHVRLSDIESETLLVLLDEVGICASAGSACASGAIEPSHVLLAMGITRDDALGALRLSLGPTTTDADVDHAAKAIADAAGRLL